MSKSHRGKGVRSMNNRGTGMCPICKKTRIKILWQGVVTDGKSVKVCKKCQGK